MLKWVNRARMGLLLSLLLPAGAAALQPELSDLAGWWSATAHHADQSTELFLHFERAEEGTTARLVVPAMSGEIPPMPVTQTETGIAIGRWSLDCAAECAGLTGVLPRALVPVHEIPVGFVRSGPPPEREPIEGRESAPVPIWTTELDSPVWAPLTISPSSLFVATENGTLHALKPKDGSILWSRPLDGSIRAEPTWTDEYGLFLHTDSESVYRLDPVTGQDLWKVSLNVDVEPRKSIDDPNFSWAHFASAAVVAHEHLIVATRAGTVHSLALETGAEVWRFAMGPPAAVTGTPAVVGDRVIFGAFDGTLRALDRSTGKLLWENPLGGAMPSDTVAVGELVWAGTRNYELHAVDPDSGHTAWTRYFWFSWIDSSPTEAAGVGYIGSSDALAVQAFDSADGAVRWSTRVPGWAWPRPAVSESAVLVGTVGQTGYIGSREGSLMALDRATGDPLWRFSIPTEDPSKHWGIASSPAVSEGRLFAADLAGKVYAFDLAPGE